MKLRLEIGPGGGYNYPFRPKIVGSDVVYVDLAFPRTHVQKFGEFVVASAEKLPFRANSFIQVVACHVLEHTDASQRVLREIYRVLTEHGSLLIEVPNFADSNATRDPDHKIVFNFIKLYKMLKLAGFRKITFLTNVGDRVPQPLRIFLQLLILIFGNVLKVKAYK